MRKIKIAQIGTSRNSHGNDIWNTLKKNQNIFEIVGYVFPENEREKFPERMADFNGYRELSLNEILNNPEIEAVTVETEEIFLTKYAILAADSGKHIHMEKPGGIGLAGFEKLIDKVRRNESVFHLGYMYRYNPYVSELLKRVKKGELGDIISVEAQMNCTHSDDIRNWLNGFPGGIMFFLGCHLIDMILQIKGIPNKVVPFNKSTGVGGITSGDFGMAVLEYENGVSFAKVNSTEVGGFLRRQLVVSGTKGTVELKPIETFCDGKFFSTKSEYSYVNFVNEVESSSTDIYERSEEMMNSFAAMVRGDKQNPYTYDYELELYKTILKCCKG